MFFIIENSEETTFKFSQTFTWFSLINSIYKIETQKSVNLFNDFDNESRKLATTRCYISNDQNRTNYGEVNGSDESIKFETKVIKSSFCDYSDAYILVTEDIEATGGNANTNVALKNCALFTRCAIHINDEHIDTADSYDIRMLTYNLTEYSDIYSHTSKSLWQFERDESPINDPGNPDNVSTNNSSSFKYKSRKLGKPGNYGVLKKCKIAVPLKHLSNFWRSLEIFSLFVKLILNRIGLKIA